MLSHLDEALPKRRSLSATEPTSRKASERVYGLSRFALRRGLNSRSRKERRVCFEPMRWIEEMVTGRVELLPIWNPISSAQGSRE